MKKLVFYGEGRLCKICGAKLSQYNHNEVCFYHSLECDRDNPQWKNALDGMGFLVPIGRIIADLDYYGEFHGNDEAY